MRVQVVGKSNVEYTDKKSGELRSSIVVHVVYDDKRVSGLAVDKIWLSPSLIKYADIQCDEYYSIDRDARGYVVDFSRLK